MWRSAIVVLAGCSFQGTSAGVASDGAHGTQGQEGLPSSPEAGHVLPDAPANFTCYGNGGLFVGCVPAQTATVTLMGALDTATEPMCIATPQPDGLDACMIAGKEINIPHLLTVTGTRPLVLLATDKIMVGGAGTIDGSSHINNGIPLLGPAANDASCGTPTAATTNAIGGGGGAGASFGQVGGNGGHGTNGTADGGHATQAQTVDHVRGGCPGAIGGTGVTAGGNGGPGGGALYLLAGGSIQIDGIVMANGGGGGPGVTNSGGGGAGTGGLIGVMAPAIGLGGAGRIYANGGGGGGGASTVPGGFGGDGQATTSTQGVSGTGGASAGAGGAGGVNTSAAAAGQDANAAGGGGGGAVGIIWVKGTPTFSGQTSPPASFQ